MGSSPPYDSNPDHRLNQRSRLQEENIPQGLKDRPQWVVWKGIEKPDGKLNKVPYQPHHPEEKASTDNPSTWNTYEKALEVFEKNPQGFDGIGYVLSEDDPFVGFDYDGCIDPETGELHELVSRQVEDLGSFAEVSPGGKGLRVLVRAKKPGTQCSTKKTPWGAEFAMYEHRRFLTLTGRVLGGYTEIREAQEAVDRVYREMFGEDQKPPPRTEGRGNDLSDEELIERACRSEKGDRFRRHHFAGDASGYASRSEADFAHLADICFWTGPDEERMVDLFLRSALYVPKKGIGYVRRSARKAIITHRGGYFTQPKERPEELKEALEKVERDWWGQSFPGIAGKTDASLERALIRSAKRIGTVGDDGNLRVSMSVRQLAEIAGCHVNTVLNYTKRAKEAGRLAKDDYRAREEDSATFILLARPSCDTLKNTRGVCLKEGVTRESRYPVADLTTEHYRWGRAHVGKGRERALCALEAFGPQTAEQLAARLGWSRTRDLKARYLDKLVELDLVEDRGGVWAIPDDPRDYAERQERVKKMPYSTIQLRAKRVRSVEGLKVTVVEESGCVASEEARKEADIERNKHKREVFRIWLAERRKAAKEREAARASAAADSPTPDAPEPEPVAKPVEEKTSTEGESPSETSGRRSPRLTPEEALRVQLLMRDKGMEPRQARAEVLGEEAA